MAISVHLLKTAFTPSQLLTPPAQIVFAGRSNVGKSSLLNALFGQKIAKTSATPGKTQSVNYYEEPNSPCLLVDLPGYGYARASREEQGRWSTLLDAFFSQSSTIHLCCVLLDARLAPQKNDLAMLDYARKKAVPLLGILSKCDKVGQGKMHACMRAWEPFFDQPLFPTSARTKKGIGALENFLRSEMLSFLPSSQEAL